MRRKIDFAGRRREMGEEATTSSGEERDVVVRLFQGEVGEVGEEGISKPTKAVVVVELMEVVEVEGHLTQPKGDLTQEKGEEGTVVTGKYFLSSTRIVNLIGFFHFYFTFGKV